MTAAGRALVPGSASPGVTSARRELPPATLECACMHAHGVGLRAGAHNPSARRGGGQPEPTGLVRIVGHGPAARVLRGETAAMVVPVTYGNTPNEYLGTWRYWSPHRPGLSPFPQAGSPSAGRRGEHQSCEYPSGSAPAGQPTQTGLAESSPVAAEVSPSVAMPEIE